MEKDKCFPVSAQIWDWMGVKPKKPCAPIQFLVTFIARYEQLNKDPDKRRKECPSRHIKDRELLLELVGLFRSQTSSYTIHGALDFMFARALRGSQIHPDLILHKSWREQTDFDTLNPIIQLLKDFRIAKKSRSRKAVLECKKRWVRLGLRKFKQPSGPFDRNLWLFYSDENKSVILTILMTLTRFKICRNMRNKILSYLVF